MKYIVTESQYNLILESEKNINFFQNLIDDKLNYIRGICENMDQFFVAAVGADSCEEIKGVESIKVTSAEWLYVMHSNKPLKHMYMTIKLMVYYSSVLQDSDFDANNLTYELEQMLRKSTGMPILINYDSTNTNKNFN